MITKKLIHKSLKMAIVVQIFCACTMAFATSSQELSTKEMELIKLRSDVQPLVESLLIKNADMHVFASLKPLTSAFNDLNKIPEDKRTVRLQSTGTNEKLWEDGPTWCNSFLELFGPEDFWTTAVLSDMSAEQRSDGNIGIKATASIKGHMQLRLQFKGRRVRTWIGNACPPGGGVGTSIGVNFAKAQDMQLLLSFNPSEDGQSVAYIARFIAPDDVSVTAEIGLGAIGNYGHPMKLEIPKTPFASGTFPLLISKAGTFQLPGVKGEKKYSILLTPVGFTANQSGISSAWKSIVQFK